MIVTDLATESFVVLEILCKSCLLLNLPFVNRL